MLLQKRKKVEEIKCEGALRHSEPWQVGLVHTRTLGQDRTGQAWPSALGPNHLGRLVSSLSVSWR